MASRAEDWLRQAERDLQHARRVLADGTFEWAAFAAQQAAEKAAEARRAVDASERILEHCRRHVLR